MEAGSSHAAAPHHDAAVRRFVYERCIDSGLPPLLSDIAKGTGTSREAAMASLERLARSRVLVLQPQTAEILMAPPFSAVPTPFVVEAPRFTCFGNCIWDALGIAAMADANVQVRTSCGDCGMAMSVHVEARRVRGEGLVHFAVPTRLWWEDVVFT